MEMTEKSTLIVNIERVVGENKISQVTVDKFGAELPNDIMCKFINNIKKAIDSSYDKINHRIDKVEMFTYNDWGTDHASVTFGLTGVTTLISDLDKEEGSFCSLLAKGPEELREKLPKFLFPKLNIKKTSLYNESGEVVIPANIEPVTPDKIKPGDFIVLSTKQGVILKSVYLNLIKNVSINEDGTLNITTIAYQRQDGFFMVYNKPSPIYSKNSTFVVLPESMRDEFVAKCIEKHPEIEYVKNTFSFKMKFEPKEGDAVFCVDYDGDVVKLNNTMKGKFPSYAFMFTCREDAVKASTAIKDKLHDISQTLYLKSNDTRKV